MTKEMMDSETLAFRKKVIEKYNKVKVDILLVGDDNVSKVIDSANCDEIELFEHNHVIDRQSGLTPVISVHGNNYIIVGVADDISPTDKHLSIYVIDGSYKNIDDVVVMDIRNNPEIQIVNPIEFNEKLIEFKNTGGIFASSDVDGFKKKYIIRTDKLHNHSIFDYMKRKNMNPICMGGKSALAEYMEHFLLLVKYR